MKYIITQDCITLYLDKIVIIQSENPNYKKIIEALKQGRPDYEIVYLLNPKMVDKAKKLLLDGKD